MFLVKVRENMCLSQGKGNMCLVKVREMCLSQGKGKYVV